MAADKERWAHIKKLLREIWREFRRGGDGIGCDKGDVAAATAAHKPFPRDDEGSGRRCEYSLLGAVGVPHEIDYNVQVVRGDGGDDLGVNHIIHSSEFTHVLHDRCTTAVVHTGGVDGITKAFYPASVLWA